MLQYQRQAVATSSPERLIVKLYDLGVAACHRGDRPKLRAVLVELSASLDFERGGEIAQRLYDLYAYCLNESTQGDLTVVCEVLDGLRSAWLEGVVGAAVAA